MSLVEKSQSLSFVRNCHIVKRNNDNSLFIENNGQVTAHLDGYAVIPIEDYQQLVASVATNKPTTPI